MRFFYVDGNIKVNSNYIESAREVCENRSHNVYVILTGRNKKFRISSHDNHHDAIEWMNNFCGELERIENEKNH